MAAGVGITAGAHRLWSHRTYKARLPLRLLLVAANSMAGENSIYTWARDHRTHHKFSETDADPHNAKVSPGPDTGCLDIDSTDHRSAGSSSRTWAGSASGSIPA